MYQLDGDPRTSGTGFGFQMVPERLDKPFTEGWTKPRCVFVNSMSDLWHPKATDAFLNEVFATFALRQRDLWLTLTKRHARLAAWFRAPGRADRVRGAAERRRERLLHDARLSKRQRNDLVAWQWPGWPLPNVGIGVSVESQELADERVPKLLQVDAAVLFLSVEPLLGPVTLKPEWLTPQGSRRWNSDGQAAADAGVLTAALTGERPPAGVDWVIVGGESGPGARPMHPDWAGALRDQCMAAGVPFFYKQWGQWAPIRPVYDQAVVDGAEDPLDAWLASKAEVTSLNTVGIRERGWRGGRAWGNTQPTPTLNPWWMGRVAAKHAAGRELDGRGWADFPNAFTGHRQAPTPTAGLGSRRAWPHGPSTRASGAVQPLRTAGRLSARAAGGGVP